MVLFSWFKGRGFSLGAIEKKRHCRVGLRKVNRLIKVDDAKVRDCCGVVFGKYQDFQIGCF
ncbi:MAG: hypothetical protein EPGJADBJ_01017 [Saprospiraceae bacterium]|nr:hypothetical protein [Saprospiraceae bacterium]